MMLNVLKVNAFPFSFDGFYHDKAGQQAVKQNVNTQQQNTNQQFGNQQRLASATGNQQFNVGNQRQGQAANLLTHQAVPAANDLINGNTGGGVYKDFAANGGFTPEQSANYMRQATSGVPAMYQQLQNQMAQQRNIQGGYAPTFGASSAALARQASEGMNSAVQGAQNNLTQQINSNRLAGAGGLQQGQIVGNSDLLNAAGQLGGMGQGNLGNATSLYGQYLGGIGGQAGANQGYENILQNNANSTKGPLDNIFQGLGAAGGLLTGVGNFRNS